MSQSRVCKRCRKLRSVDAFVGASGRPTLCCSSCLERGRAVNRAMRQRMGPSAVRAMNLRTKYGITEQEYDARRAAQQYRCAICGTHERDMPSHPVGRPRLDGTPTADAVRLVVDHCHETRRVRGLLCVSCNAALGHFKDSPRALRAAVRYLEQAYTPALRGVEGPV